MNADEIEKAKEIVRALRDYASDCDDDDCFQCTFACVCGKCGNNAPKIIADLIENLTSQLADYHHMEQLVDGKMAENQRLRKINEKLQSQLTEIQRREKAAVEDLKYYLENNEDNGVVYIPKFAVEKIINRSGSHEAEKGEAE